jgi:hypothetical protein
MKVMENYHHAFSSIISIKSDFIVLNAEKTQHGIERMAVAG